MKIIIIMKTNFFYVKDIDLNINLDLLLSFQLVERAFLNIEKGIMDKRMECCLSIGTNAFFCDEKYYYELCKLLANGN